MGSLTMVPWCGIEKNTGMLSEDMVRRRDDVVGFFYCYESKVWKRPVMSTGSPILWLIARNPRCDTGRTNLCLRGEG